MIAIKHGLAQISSIADLHFKHLCNNDFSEANLYHEPWSNKGIYIYN